MHSLTEESVLWIPKTEEEKEMVREQMNRLLHTSHFKNSRRYPALFRFIVEEALEGRGEFLKERLMGIRVFDRPPDYDTSSDPIVRVTVAEIRKRIAQYYHEEAHDTEMRIELLPGSYTPEFRPRKSEAERHPTHVEHISGSIAVAEPPTTSHQASEPQTAIRPQPRGHIGRYIIAAAVVAILACIGIFSWRDAHPSAVDDFWGPLLATHHPITFCLPNGAGNVHGPASILPTRDGSAPPTSRAPKSDPTFLDHESLGENVVFSDALAVTRISNLVATMHGESRFRLNVSTTLDDLRQGPSVLVGGLDNQWTLRVLDKLQFHFAGNDEQGYWIADTKNPPNNNWSLDLKTNYHVVDRDYAIIARVHDQATGELVVIVAGIGMSGTAAAGEFLVDPRQLEQLRRRIGPGFRDHDFEAVLSTDVVNGISGSPHVLTVAVW